MKYYLCIESGTIIFASSSDSLEYEEHIRRTFGGKFLYIKKSTYNFIKQFSKSTRYDTGYQRELCNFI